MNRFWKFAEWLPYQFDGDVFLEHCRILNDQEVSRAGALITRDFRQEFFPTVQLQLTLPDFDADCFQTQMLTSVSERMRDAMALSSAEIQYFDVDACASTNLARSKNFKVMNIPVVENISEPSLSKYEMRRLVPDTPEMAVWVYKIAIKPDVQPGHQLFYDEFFRGYRFCTDALAMRILEAGCTGVRFIDPDQIGPVSKRFRTLRGLEEGGEWDPVSNVLHTTLIEAAR